MTSFVSLANWMCIKCEKRWSRATKVSRNLQSQLLGSLKRVWMCESLLAIAFNCQVVPLVIPMRFECSLRSVSVCGVWGGESTRAVWEACCSSVSKPGVKLALWKTFGELGCQCGRGFKEMDKAGCTLVRQNRILHTTTNFVFLIHNPFG